MIMMIITKNQNKNDKIIIIKSDNLIKNENMIIFFSIVIYELSSVFFNNFNYNS